MKNHNNPSNQTLTVSFTYSLDNYEKTKNAVTNKLNEYQIRKDVVTFEDETNTIKFRYLSNEEVHYVFDLGPSFENMKIWRAFYGNDGLASLSHEHENYLKNKINDLRDNSREYFESNKNEQDVVKNILLAKNTQESKLTVYNLLTQLEKENISFKSLIISEDHKSNISKLAIIDKESIDKIKQRKGVILLEHFCSELFQSEIDACVKAKTHSPLLMKYLSSLDVKYRGFSKLVSELVKNGIPIVAIDSQASYNFDSISSHSDDVAGKRQLVNIEWKKI